MKKLLAQAARKNKLNQFFRKSLIHTLLKLLKSTDSFINIFLLEFRFGQEIFNAAVLLALIICSTATVLAICWIIAMCQRQQQLHNNAATKILKHSIVLYKLYYY